jgi:hypothetical protein
MKTMGSDLSRPFSTIVMFRGWLFTPFSCQLKIGKSAWSLPTAERLIGRHYKDLPVIVHDFSHSGGQAVFS